MHCKDFLPLRVIGKVADDVAATITITNLVIYCIVLTAMNEWPHVLNLGLIIMIGKKSS